MFGSRVTFPEGWVLVEFAHFSLSLLPLQRWSVIIALLMLTTQYLSTRTVNLNTLFSMFSSNDLI